MSDQNIIDAFAVMIVGFTVIFTVGGEVIRVIRVDDTTDPKTAEARAVWEMADILDTTGRRVRAAHEISVMPHCG